MLAAKATRASFLWSGNRESEKRATFSSFSVPTRHEELTERRQQHHLSSSSPPTQLVSVLKDALDWPL